MDARKPGRRSDEATIDDELLSDAGEIVIPVVSEEVTAFARPLQTRVRIQTSVTSQVERVEVPLQRSVFEVKRIPVERVLEEAVHTRTEDGVTIIPVMEERVVIRKELVLVEEIHLIPRSSTEMHVEDVTLRREVVSVERFSGGREARNTDG